MYYRRNIITSSFSKYYATITNVKI